MTIRTKLLKPQGVSAKLRKSKEPEIYEGIRLNSEAFEGTKSKSPLVSIHPPSILLFSMAGEFSNIAITKKIHEQTKQKISESTVQDLMEPASLFKDALAQNLLSREMPFYFSTIEWNNLHSVSNAMQELSFDAYNSINQIADKRTSRKKSAETTRDDLALRKPLAELVQEALPDITKFLRPDEFEKFAIKIVPVVL